MLHRRVFAVAFVTLLVTAALPVAAATGEPPIAVVARTGDGFATIQAALDAASPGDTVTVLMDGSASPSARVEALTIAKNGVTLCATVSHGTCSAISAPGRWQASATTWATPPVAWQGEALRAGAVGSTSFFPQSAQPGAPRVHLSDIRALSFNFLLETGSCSGGGLRFQVGLDTNGDGARDTNIYAYPPAGFACTVGKWVVIDVMDGGHWGLSALGGPGSGATKAQADALAGAHPVVAINLVFDGAPPTSVAWFDNKRVNDAVLREQVDTACLDASSPACATVHARPATILDAPSASASTVQISGSDVTLKGFTIRHTGAQQAVRFTGSGARVLDNEIVGNGPLSGTQFGIRAAGAVPTPWLIANNTITQEGHTGIYVSGQAPGKIADNDVNQHRANALYVEGSAGLLTIERNDLTQVAQANLRVASTRPMLLRDNTMGVSEFTMDFTALVQTVDARYNHWGAYTRADIEATMHEEGPGRTLDISCYYGLDGEPVCPPAAAFTFAPGTPHHTTSVAFTDATTPGGNAIASRAWSFGDGATSAATNPSHTYGRSGTFTVELTVTDDEGFSTTASQLVGVANTAPVIGVLGDQTASEGVLLSFPIPASDADGDALTFGATTALPAGATIHPTTGAFTWSLSYAQAGTYGVTVRVTDGDLSDTRSFTIDVANVDRAPTLGPIPDRQTPELTTLVIPLIAADPDGDAVVLSTSILPGWVTLHASGPGLGSLVATPGIGERGAYPITVTATAGGLSASRTFVLTVVPNTGLTFTAAGPVNFRASPGETVTFTATLRNDGAETDTFTFSATNTRGWTMGVPTAVTLAPGESALVTATVVPSIESARTSARLIATSATNAAATRTLVWSAETPIALTFAVVGSPSLANGVHATVTATWLDGSPAVGAPIRATEIDQALGRSSSVQGTTDAQGAFTFEFEDVHARIPGPHDVHVALSGLLPSWTRGLYDVGVA